MGKVIKKVAPVLGTVAGTFLGGPLGGAVGGALGGLVSGGGKLGGGGTDTTTTRAIQTPEEQKLNQEAIESAQRSNAFGDLAFRRFSSSPSFFPGDPVADLNDIQLTALQQQIQAAQGVNSFLPGLVGGSLDFGLNGVLDPGANPFAQAHLNAILNPIQQRFQEQILPGIGSAAEKAGAFGGARQGIIESQAAQGVAREMANAAARFQSQQYQQGLDTFSRTQALLPQSIAALFSPNQQIAAAGDVFQNQAQAEIGGELDRFEAPFTRLQQLGALIGGAPQFVGASGSSVNTPRGGGGIGGAIGGASSALGLLGGLQSTGLLSGEQASGGLGAALAGLGALGGLFG